jgi:hypothetical protein
MLEDVCREIDAELRRRPAAHQHRGGEVEDEVVAQPTEAGAASSVVSK